MDSKTKKTITDEWVKAFPDLNAYSQNKIYKIIGPFVCGIELITLPRSENYRPHFVIYSLWKSNIKYCLEYPVLMQEFYNSRKLQLTVPFTDISGKHKDAQSVVLKNLKISFEGNITLESFYFLIADVLQNDPYYKSHSGKMASLFELKFYAALYTGNQSQVQSVLNQIYEASKNWNMQIFEKWRGKFHIWVKGLQEKVHNHEEFLKQIEANKLDKKLSKLKSSELKA